VKEFLIPAHIYQSYSKNKRGAYTMAYNTCSQLLEAIIHNAFNAVFGKVAKN